MTEEDPGKAFRPSVFHEVQTVDQLKAFTDVLRLQMLAILRHREATNQQMAQELGQAQAKTLHHLRMLVEVGLVRLTRTEIKGGNVEKYYRAIARDFLLHTHLPEAYPVRGQIMSALTERINLEMIRARQEYPDELIPIFRRSNRLTEDRRREFYKKLDQLLDDYLPRRITNADGDLFRFAGFVYRDTEDGDSDGDASESAQSNEDIR